jgi:PIN domain nuclease of toxin-antitoxin system
MATRAVDFVRGDVRRRIGGMGAVKLLLDTHAFYWWCVGDPALSLTARTAIADIQNEKYVSAITAWEFITKFRSGKEPGFSHIAADVSGAVAAQGLSELPITMRHAEMAANLPLHHKDPMDRLLIAQAIVEDMTILTIDGVFTSYGTKIMW